MDRELAREDLVGLIKRYQHDPLAFVLEQFDPPPRLSEDQMGLFSGVRKALQGRKSNHVSVVSGTGTGKTTSLALLTIWGVSVHPECKIPCTATSERQVKTILWTEIHKWLPRLRPLFRRTLVVSATKLEMVGNRESFAYVLPSNEFNPAGFQGIHSQFVMFIFDEASGIPQTIFDAAEGSLTEGAEQGGNSLFICTGNGNLASGAFYDTHNKMAPYWQHLSWSSRNSPFCGSKYIETMERMYGRDSNQVRIRVDGKFPKDDPDTLIMHDWVQEALGREVRAGERDKRIAGVDPKGSGSDTIGFCIRQGRVAYGFDEWPTTYEEAQIAGKIVEMWKAKAFDEINVDGIGVGSGVCSILEQEGVPHRRVNVGMAAMEEAEQCNRLRDELWWKAREWFRSGTTRIEAENREALDKVIHELTTPKYSNKYNGKITVEAKDSLKRSERIGYSPGLADAFVLTFADLVPLTREHRILFEEVPGSNDFVW